MRLRNSGSRGGLKSWAPEIDPMLCISGINHGPNLSVDVLHSGTVSAAREASLYGMPAIATSLATYSHRRFDDSLSVIVDLIDRCSGSLPDSPPKSPQAQRNGKLSKRGGNW